LGNSARAREYLAILKSKFPTDEKILIARLDCGENGAGIVPDKPILPKPEEEPSEILSSE
jgi:hypothetical protein